MTTRFYISAPSATTLYVEKKLQKTLNDEKTLNTSDITIKEIFIYFKDEICDKKIMTNIKCSLIFSNQ